MGLKMDDWFVFYLIYYTCDALRAHATPSKDLPLFPAGLLTLILCKRCKRVERISALAGTRLFLAFRKSLS